MVRDFILTVRQKLPETKDPKIEYFPKTKKTGLIANFTLGHTGGLEGRIKHNDNDL